MVAIEPGCYGFGISGILRDVVTIAEYTLRSRTRKSVSLLG